MVTALFLALALGGPSQAQQTPEKAPSPPTFRVDTGVVMLDVIVRDKKGRLVRDLRSEEIQVFEDGARQEITAVRFVETGREPVPAAAPGAPAAPAAAAPEAKQINLVTLLFDQLGAEARIIARKAALDFLESDHRSDLWISVFQIDRRMHLLQQFTTDRVQVRAAVDLATGAAHAGRTDLTAEAARVGREGDAAASASDAAASAVAGGGAGAASAGAAGRDAAFAQIEQNTLDMTDRLERQLQGESSLFGLLALANQQQRLAGRKTILYFSEGLQVTSRLEQVFRSAVSEANRANVSIYAVDARGLEHRQPAHRHPAAGGTGAARRAAAADPARRRARHGGGGDGGGDGRGGPARQHPGDAGRPGREHRRLPDRQQQRHEGGDGARLRRHRRLLRGHVRAGPGGDGRQVPRRRR